MSALIVKILGDVTYVPEFMGNTEMQVTFSRLSGSQEMEVLQGSEGDKQTALFLAGIKKIEKPFKIELASGKVRTMKKQDIVELSELKELYYELLKEYIKISSASGDDIKKS